MHRVELYNMAYNKSLEYLRSLGFRVVEECRAASGQ